MKSTIAIVLLVLPSVALGALVFGGADTAKVCGDTLVNGTVKQNVPDPNDCSQYYICNVWFQSKMTCKNGNHFNAVEEKCTDPCSAGCDTTLVCTTTSAPEEPSTEAALVTDAAGTEAASEATTDAAPEAASEASSKATSGSASEASSEAATESAAETASREAPEAPADAAVSAVSETEPIESEPVAEAEVATTGAVTEVEDAVETTTALWQLIVKHFNKPPSTIPEVGGTVPTSV